jgi:putative transposase
MTSINWSRNEVIEISGELYRVESRATTGELNLLHIKDNRFVVKSETELATLWDRGELRRLHDPDGKLTDRQRSILEQPFEKLPEVSQLEAKFREPYIRAFIERRLRFRSPRILEPLIAEVAAANGHDKRPSARQVARWLKSWNEIGSPDLRDIRCIAPRYHLRGNSSERFAPEVEDITWDLIDEMALKPERESAADIVGEIERLIDNIDLAGIPERFIEQEGPRRGKLKRPSARTVHRMLNSIPTDIVVRSERGAVEAERTCEPVVGGPQPVRPLQQVEIDSTKLDVQVLDSERNMVLGRPWLTVVLDRRTRAVLGVLITFHPPSAHTLMRALRNAIKPKDELLARYPNIRGRWPCLGKPKAIVVDNAMEYHSRSLTAACLQLGIDIIYCPVRKPRYKGRVERWFGRLAKQLLHKIPGTTFSHSKQRGDYESEKKAIMTLADLRACILKWIVDDYMPSIHRGLKDAPLRKWEKEAHVALPPRADELDVLLSNVEDRALTRKGIELEGLLFSMKSREFKEFINRADKPDRVRVKVDYENLRSVKVEDWRTGRYVTVPSVDPEYTEGLSMAEHMMLVGRVKAGLKKYERVTMKALIEARHEFRQMVQRLKREKKLSSKRLKAFIGEEEDLPVAEKQLPEVDDSAELPAEVSEEAPTAKKPNGNRPKPPRRPHKSKAKTQPKPTPAGDGAADDEDDLAALMARTDKSGIVAQTTP